MLQSSPNNAHRSRVIFYSLAVCLLGVSLAAGYYLPTSFTDLIGLTNSSDLSTSPACGCGHKEESELPPCCAARLAAEKEAAPTMSEFTLTDADRKDQLETPTLAVDSLGRVFAAWASQTGEQERTLFLASSLTSGKSFDPPKPVQKSEIYSYQIESKGRTITRSIRMVPHLVAAGDNLALGWLASANENSTVMLMLAESTDGGLSFGTPICVHQSDKARPTYTSLSANALGRVTASWLDHRTDVQLPYFAVRSAPGAAFGEEQPIPAGEAEKGICPCCPTASVVAADGTVYVAYRNLVAGHRDMFVAKWTENGLETPVPVVEPTWQFDGCPHDGPSLAIVGETLHIVWMDGHTGTPRVYHGQAATSDLKFTTRPIHAAGPGTQGNAKLAATADGLVAVWEESLEDLPAEEKQGDEPTAKANHAHGPTGSGRAIMFAYAPAGGEFGPASAALKRPGRFQTRPAVIGSSEGKFVTAFNELDEQGKRVVIVRQPLQPPATETPTASPVGEALPADEPEKTGADS